MQAASYLRRHLGGAGVPAEGEVSPEAIGMVGARAARDKVPDPTLGSGATTPAWP